MAPLGARPLLLPPWTRPKPNTALSPRRAGDNQRRSPIPCLRRRAPHGARQRRERRPKCQSRQRAQRALRLFSVRGLDGPRRCPWLRVSHMGFVVSACMLSRNRMQINTDLGAAALRGSPLPQGGLRDDVLELAPVLADQQWHIKLLEQNKIVRQRLGQRLTGRLILAA